MGQGTSAMTGPYLIDTDILVDYLRGRDAAIRWLDGLSWPRYVSTITVAELYAGVRDGEERPRLDDFVETFSHVGIDTQTARDAGLVLRQYQKSHGIGLADAVIAASAIALNLTLVTHNRKHFPMLERVHTPYRRH